MSLSNTQKKSFFQKSKKVRVKFFRIYLIERWETSNILRGYLGFKNLKSGFGRWMIFLPWVVLSGRFGLA